MAGELQGKTIAFLATDGVEQIEYTEPRKAVEQAGGAAHLVSPESGEIQGFNHLDKGDTFQVDKAVSEASAAEYDGLVLPGGSPTPTSCATTPTPSSSCARSSRPASPWPRSATAPGRWSRRTWSEAAR